MEVLQLITTLEPDGAQVQALETALRIDPARARVRIGFLAGPGSAAADYPDLRGRILDFSRGGRFDPLCVARIARFLRRTGCSLLHTHLVHAGIVGTLAAGLAGTVRLVSTRHYGHDDKEGTWLYRYADRLLGRANRVIAVSEAVRLHAERRGIAKPDRIVTIPNGIDTERFVPGTSRTADPPIIGTAGRLHAQKGHEDLLAAFAILAPSMPGVRLEIIGDGPLRAALENRARSLSILDRVDFAGRVPHREMPARIARWTLCAMPSRWEAFGVAAAEAMAMEKPVVASRVEGLSDLIEDGVSGRLVDLESEGTGGLARAIEEILRDEAGRERIGCAARRRIVESFSIERSARETERVYQSALALEG